MLHTIVFVRCYIVKVQRIWEIFRFCMWFPAYGWWTSGGWPAPTLVLFFLSKEIRKTYICPARASRSHEERNIPVHLHTPLFTPRSSHIYLPSLIKTMKIILTGSTGFIGQEILLQCLSHPQITSLIILSRRALPVSDPKLKVVLLEDFTRMPEEVLGELKGCDGCIWFVLPYILYSLNKFNI